MRTTAIAALVSCLLLVGCYGEKVSGPEVAELLDDARVAYIGLDALRAAELVAAAHERAPDDPDVILWRARTLSELDLFQEAIPAAERAVEVAPDDPLAWELHLYTYGWGGIYRSNRQWLDRALEISPQAIRRFPDRSLLYDYYRAVASNGLNQLPLYLEGLRELEDEVGDSPLYRYRLWRAELEMAETEEDSERMEALKERMRAELDALAAQPEHSLLDLRILAYANSTLEREEESRRWLEALEATPEGRMHGARLRSYLIAVEAYENRDDVMGMATATRQQGDLFEPAWTLQGDMSMYGRRASLREMELGQLASALTAPEPLEDEVRSRFAARIAELAPVVARAGSTGSVFTLIRAGDALVETGMHLDAARSLATDLIQALDEQRPGLLYAGLTEDREELARDDYRASFLRIRGRARAQLGDAEGARADLAAAVAAAPTAENYRALGTFHRATGDDRAAYDAFVSALAWGFPRWRQALADGTREEAATIAADLGIAADGLDDAIAARAAEVDLERKERILGERVGRETPDVKLVDLEEAAWRLRELDGKVVVLNFWATWCGPCLAEMPHYQALIDEYSDADDVVFLAVYQDRGTRPVLDYLEENGFTFAVAMDDGGVGTEFKVTGIPSHFMIGKSGRIEYASTGFSSPESYNREMRWRIEELRNESR